MRTLILLAVFVTGAWSCNHNNPTPTPTPVVSDAGAPAVDTAPPVDNTPCGLYCALGVKLHCAWAQPTAAGHTCVEVCTNANDPSGPVRWSFSCRLAATSCDAVARCQ